MATASSGSTSEGSGHSGKSHGNRIRRVRMNNTLRSEHLPGQRSSLLDSYSGNVTNEDLHDFCSSVEEKDIAKKAVAIVIEATQSPQSVVSLCTMVSELFTKKQRLEVQNIALKKALAKARSTLPQLHHKATQVKVPAKPVVDRKTSTRLKSIRVMPYSCSASVQTEIAGIDQPVMTTRVPAMGSRTIPSVEKSTPLKTVAEVHVALPEIPGLVCAGPSHYQGKENSPRNGTCRDGKDSPPAIPQKRIRQRSACPVLQSMCTCCVSSWTDSQESGDSSPNLPGQSVSPCVGDYVRCGQLIGVTKFIGPIDQSDAIYVGLHLDSPVGHHNGSIHGVQFFRCPQNYGAFVPLKDVIILTKPGKMTMTRHDSPSGR